LYGDLKDDIGTTLRAYKHFIDGEVIKNIKKQLTKIEGNTTHKDRKPYIKRLKDEYVKVINIIDGKLKHQVNVESKIEVGMRNINGMIAKWKEAETKIKPIVKVNRAEKLTNITLNINRENESIIEEVPDFPIMYTGDCKDKVPTARLLALIDKDKYNIDEVVIRYLHMSLLGLPIQSKDYVQPIDIAGIKDILNEEQGIVDENKDEEDDDTDTESIEDDEGDEPNECVIDACVDFDED
jgi:hypothetical protein